jgi:hypothetical protein
VERAQLLFRSTLAEWRASNMGTSSIPASGGGGLRPRYQKFTSSGTFTLPDGYGAANPLLVNIQVIGGGGGGGGWTTNTTSPSGLNLSFSGNRNSYFGSNWNWPAGFGSSEDITGRPGGSGGLASTQLSLTANLTITVGAAGTTGRVAYPNFTGNIKSFNSLASDNNNGSSQQNWNFIGNDPSNQFTPTEWNTYTLAGASGAKGASGGTGGTSIAGAVEATGGAGATVNYNMVTISNAMAASGDFQNINEWRSLTRNVGAGGTPAGSSGDATPLLGTIAGGSTNNTSVRGSFGIGGKQSDGNTSTGVEGTGGGASSIAASGAVILTWWQ